ncbi:hypothetical protein GCM10009846_29660 [Agrococcus versicolor]|uniref:Uncharacterized protein n=1 Tax=Agrococcus versicolor TaxID=501482 RepID=A0ABN3AXT5_9MICO
MTEAPAGELHVLAQVVGMDGSQPRASIVRGLVGPPSDMRRLPAPDGAELTFIVFGPGGVELVMKHDVVSAVVVHLAPGADHSAYPRIERLLPGGGATLTRSDLSERLGEPADLDGQDLFAVGESAALVDYADGVATRLTLVADES